MEATLRALYRLQQIDLELDDLDAGNGDLPTEVASLQEKVTELAAIIAEKERALTELRKNRSSSNVEMQELQDRTRTLNERLRTVRNNKEYDATTSEIESAEQQLQALQKALAPLDDKEAGLMRDIKNLQDSRGEMEKEIEEKQGTLDMLQETHADEIVELRAARKEVLAEVDPELLQKYTHIRTACSDTVVKVRKGACTGCYRAITPQIIVEIRRNEQLYFCEHCGRFLVHEDIAESVTIA